MDIKKRLLRRPLRTILWQAVLIAMSLLIGVSSVLIYSSQRLTTVLDEHHTTIAVQQMRTEKLETGGWRTYPVRLYPEDIEALRALDMVKDIDLRTLTGAYIPELSARIGLTNWWDMFLMDVDQFNEYGANRSYEKVIVVGTVEKAWLTSDDCIVDFDLSAVGGPELTEGYSYRALMSIDQVVVAHEDYVFYPNEKYSQYNGKIIVEMPGFYTEGDDRWGTNFFEEGGTYVLRGSFDPTVSKRSGDAEDISHATRLSAGMISLQGTSYCLQEGNQLVAYTESEIGSGGFDIDPDGDGIEKILRFGGDRRVLAEKVETTVEDLLATAHWQQIVTLYRQTLHSFPVLGTENLESIHCFVQNEATVVSGRMIEQEEYDNGEKVCIISESVATAADIQVGDTVTFNQFRVPKDYGSGNDSLDHGSDGSLNNPAIGYEPIPDGFETENEAFTVVGIYRLENEWEDSAYAITPNTVFVPQKAQIDGGFGGASYNAETVKSYWESSGDDGEWNEVTGPYTEIVNNGVFGVYMSILLENGTMEAFQEAIKNTDYADRLFLTFDQGYEAARESIQSVISMAFKLLAFAVAVWMLLLLLYILLYQSAERKNLGIMRSVGAESRQLRRYLFFGGWLPATVGVLVGTFLSNTVTALVQDKLIRLTLTQVQSSAHSGGTVLDSGALAEMLAQSTLSVWSALLLAAVQIAIIGVFLWIHAGRLSRKKPGALIGV